MILKFGGFDVLGHGSRNESFFCFLLLILLILSLSFLLSFSLNCIFCFSISQVLELYFFHQIENSHLVSCLTSSSSWWLSPHCYLSWRSSSKLIFFLVLWGATCFIAMVIFLGCISWWSFFDCWLCALVVVFLFLVSIPLSWWSSFRYYSFWQSIFLLLVLVINFLLLLVLTIMFSLLFILVVVFLLLLVLVVIFLLFFWWSSSQIIHLGGCCFHCCLF